MAELKEMAEKGIDPSGDNQGVLAVSNFYTAGSSSSGKYPYSSHERFFVLNPLNPPPPPPKEIEV